MFLLLLIVLVVAIALLIARGGWWSAPPPPTITDRTVRRGMAEPTGTTVTRERVTTEEPPEGPAV